jgi:hypothetical protein
MILCSGSWAKNTVTKSRREIIMYKITAKRFFTITLAFIMIFSLVIFPASAVSNNDSITLTYDEIENSSIELKGDYITVVEQSAVNSQAQKSKKLEYCSEVGATVLIAESEEEAARIYNELIDIQSEESAATAKTSWNSGSGSKNKSSAVIGVKLTLAVYYKYTTESGHDWYKMTKVIASNDKPSSSTAVIGSGFVVSSQTLTCGVQGQNLEGLNGLKNYSSTVNIGKNPVSYTFTAPTSWPTVCEDTGLLGATYTLKATRNGTTYSVSVTNNIFNNLGG